MMFFNQYEYKKQILENKYHFLSFWQNRCNYKSTKISLKKKKYKLK